MASSTQVERVFNFSAGPAAMPLPVLQKIQADLLALPGVGSSILEISHRSPAFTEILKTAEHDLRQLMGVPDNYKVLFLQGGSRLQFSMIPMNLLRGSGKTAEYVVHGAWGKYALNEAVKEGDAKAIWDGGATNYDRLPAAGALHCSDAAAYVHITSNETIQGVQFDGAPAVGPAPLVCDFSSDFISRPVDVGRYGLIYACAQKNAGAAGVTVVILREDLLSRSQDSLPGYMNYKAHADAGSLYNTPCTFAIYTLGLIVQWLRDEVGGLEAMHQRNREKAKLLYDVIDASGGFYRPHAQVDSRSLMNVTFRLPDEELEKRFVAQAAERGLTDLKGHRSVGGIRASIYNAMPIEGVRELRDYMEEFHKLNG
ncbi:MAG: 3-phosphoserine/phosphohydroxythreonine transaminase [Pirellulaceae bacterium]